METAYSGGFQLEDDDKFVLLDDDVLEGSLDQYEFQNWFKEDGYD